MVVVRVSNEALGGLASNFRAAPLALSLFQSKLLHRAVVLLAWGGTATLKQLGRWEGSAPCRAGLPREEAG